MSDEGSRKIILAVDDAPENLDVIKSILVPEYTVMAAVNGTVALKIAEARMPELILLDIMMPEMDGYEVCRRLKSNAKTSAIPVVFVSAHDQAADEAKGLELGAVAYIMKPVDPALLRECVRKQLP